MSKMIYKISVGILTVSDTCFSGECEDKSGAQLVDLLLSPSSKLLSDIEVDSVQVACVPDEIPQIRTQLLTWADHLHLHLILTTGGTGVSRRDVTPEATRSVIDKDVWGLASHMVATSSHITPTALLSRPVCGVRGDTLIINLPGSSKASKECLEFVASAIPHALHLIRREESRVRSSHRMLQGLSSATVSSKVDVTNVADRDRHSVYPMIEVDKALETIHEEAGKLDCGSIKLPVKEALGMVLVETLNARDSLPPFPASIKDGYAVRSADGTGVRKVISFSDAGLSHGKLEEVKPGECVRISTGAPIPAGADAVVQVEDTRLDKSSCDGRDELEVEVLVKPTAAQDIRPIGVDIKYGESVAEQGNVVTSNVIGLLASIGVNNVNVREKPRVAIISTGNELVSHDTHILPPNCIRDCNKPLLISLLHSWGYPCIDGGILKDTPDAVLQGLLQLLPTVDILVTTGGVSMGERDVLKQVLTQDLDATIHFGRVHMKPGKPTVFSTLKYENKRRIIFSLPGNPVSAAVTAQLFLLPALKIASGLTNFTQHIMSVYLGSEDIHLDPRPEYQRAVIKWGGGIPTASTTGLQQSSRLSSMRGADCLLILPPSTPQHKIIQRGETVNAILMNN